MSLKTIELINFRSYNKAIFDLNPSLNLVVGPNGSGKTNLLESLYVLANTKSWRGRDRALVAHGEDGWRIVASEGSKQYEVRFTKTPSLKQTRINNRRRMPTQYLGQLQAVLFEPNSVQIINGSPEVRRRWLNQVLMATDKRYLEHFMQYRHLLTQRNRLLKQSPTAVKQQIFAWDLPLVENARYLVEKRLELLDFVNQIIGKLYQRLAGDEAQFSFGYLANVSLKNYAESLLTKLTKELNRDMRFGYSTIGPHRDDISIKFNSRSMAVVASRGELRSGILATKLAEAKWRQKITKRLPLLLFDDVFGELDTNRRRLLLAQLKGAQAVITTTENHGLGRYLPRRYTIIKLTKK